MTFAAPAQRAASLAMIAVAQTVERERVAAFLDGDRSAADRIRTAVQACPHWPDFVRTVAEGFEPPEFVLGFPYRDLVLGWALRETDPRFEREGVDA